MAQSPSWPNSRMHVSALPAATSAACPHAQQLIGSQQSRVHHLQVESLREHEASLQDRVANREARVSELKSARQELVDKLLAGEGDVRQQEAARLEAEIAKFQATAQVGGGAGPHVCPREALPL